MTDVQGSTPSKLYTCATCGKEFTDQRALAGHSLSHKEDVECVFCGRKVGIAGLGSHIRSCPKNPNRNPHRKTKCPECGRPMLRKSVGTHLARVCPVAKYKRDHGIEVKYETTYDAEKAAGTLSEPEPDTPVEAPATMVPPSIASDDELLVVLDMLLPNGFKAQHFPLVQNWMEATRTLINQISQ